MYQEISSRGAFKYRKSLEDDTTSTDLVEFVDSIIGDSGDLAESKCRKRRPEFFSLPLTQQRVKVSLLRAHLNSIRSQRDRSEQISCRMNRLGISIDLPLTQHLTRQALKAAREKLQELPQEHASLRQEELKSKISLATLSSDKNRAKALRSIKSVENARQTYQILRAMKRKTGQSTLDRIDIPASWPPVGAPFMDLIRLEDPKTCNKWRTITDPREIEYYLVMRNRLHFGQAEGTPFTQSPLREALDWSASSTAAEALLQGEYQIDNDSTVGKEEELIKDGSHFLTCVGTYVRQEGDANPDGRSRCRW